VVVDTEVLETDAQWRESALLDANVLHPMVICDLLVRLALEELYRPVWSDRILEEVVNSVLRRRPDIPEARMRKRIALMKQALPGAEIAEYEPLLSATRQFGTDDHVVAAAVQARADVIVTDNIRDFPLADLAPFGIRAQTVDDFLVDLWARQPQAIRRVLAEQASATRNPPLSVSRILDGLQPAAPNFVKAVRAPEDGTPVAGRCGE
jgi:hypothetical protein